jgi:hypothetical protein
MHKVFVFILLVCSAGLSQFALAQGHPCDPRDRSPFDASNRGGRGGPGDTVPADVRHEQAKAANKQRQSELKKDTDRLFQLASELKQKVDSTTENQLSLEVIHKTEEIEKLAKSVRDKMKGEGYVLADNDCQ